MSEFAYHPYYCEENVWHLCEHPSLAEQERWVVWIASRAGHCPLWAQKAADEGEPIFWDYHVLLVARASGAEPWLAWDLDTAAGWPCPLGEYLGTTFPHAGRLPARFDPLFRVVSADDHVRLLASDRSHMQDRRGRWLHPPPPWPEIGEGRENTLARFRDLHDPIAGRVVGLAQLRHEFR